MKRKLINSLLIALILIPCIGLLGGCRLLLTENWTVVRAATCTQEGLKRRKNDAGEIEESIIPKTEHNYGNLVTIIDSTCTEEGLMQKTCKDCGYVKDVPKSIHHNFDNTLDFDEVDHWLNCTNCDQKVGITIEHRFETEYYPIVVYGLHFCEVIGYEIVKTCEEERCDVEIRDTVYLTENSIIKNDEQPNIQEVFHTLNTFSGEIVPEFYTVNAFNGITDWSVNVENETATRKKIKLTYYVDEVEHVITNFYGANWEINSLNYSVDGNYNGLLMVENSEVRGIKFTTFTDYYGNEFTYGISGTSVTYFTFKHATDTESNYGYMLNGYDTYVYSTDLSSTKKIYGFDNVERNGRGLFTYAEYYEQYPYVSPKSIYKYTASYISAADISNLKKYDMQDKLLEETEVIYLEGKIDKIIHKIYDDNSVVSSEKVYTFEREGKTIKIKNSGLKITTHAEHWSNVD